MRIYSIFQNTLVHEAQQAMFNRSKTWDDVLIGKMMLFNKAEERKIMARLENYRGLR